MNICCDGCQILNDLFRALCLSSTRLPTKIEYNRCRLGLVKVKRLNVRNEDTLIFAFFAHINPSAFSNCKDVRWVVISPLTTILLNDRIGVKR